MAVNPEIQRAVERLCVAMDLGQRIEEVMRADERGKGHTIVKPGEVPWLPVDDWDPTVVVSIDGNRVRLVAILAKNPGSGAFRRLVDGIQAAGLIPCVVCPTRELEATLTRWKWKRKEVGSSFDNHETYWRPRQRKAA
jgi:hypothetical protein